MSKTTNFELGAGPAHIENFKVEDYYDEDVAWEAAVSAAHRLSENGHAPENIIITEYVGDAPVVVRAGAEIFG